MSHTELKFTSEGVSCTLYDDDGHVADETWYTYAEVENLKGDEHVAILEE